MCSSSYKNTDYLLLLAAMVSSGSTRTILATLVAALAGGLTQLLRGRSANIRLANTGLVLTGSILATRRHYSLYSSIFYGNIFF